jgi:DNA-binding transcriptional LysR family regulator
LAFIEADAAEHLDMLEHGEVHFAVGVINAVELDDNRFGSFLLQRFHILAVGVPSFDLGKGETIEIRALLDHPLLLPDASYVTRQLFDAACRLASLRPEIVLESASSHTLLAMAEAGHGVAVVPSILRLDGGNLRLRRLAHRGELLQPAAGVIWDKRRMLPHYAQTFSKALADHLRAVFPATRPKHSNGDATRRRPVRAKR